VTRFPIGSDERDIRAVYGDPAPHLVVGGKAVDSSWPRAILAVAMLFPSPVPISWAPHQLARSVSPHHLLVDSLDEVFRDLARSDAWKHVRDYAGCYAYRTMRGGSRLSLHSWAAALDLNARDYPLGRTADQADPFVREVVPVFESHGWTWGGRWSRPDAQHFQATVGA